jgi:hypothetical protein
MAHSKAQIQKAIEAAAAAGDQEAVADLQARLADAPDDFSAREMIKNVPGSAWETAKAVTAPIHSPVDTAKGLWRAGSGAAELLIPGEQGNEDYARSVGQGIKERYGGVSNLKTTLQNDPVGLVTDVAGLLTGGSATAARALPRAAAAAGRVGRAIDPVVAAQRAAGAVVPRKLPRALTESALKPPTTMPRADRAKVVDTILDEGVLPNEKGVRQLGETQRDLNDQLDVLIGDATRRGGSVPTARVTAGLPKVRAKMGGPTLEAAADLKDIDAAELAFLEHMAKTGRSRMTVQDLQDFKTDAYKRINFGRSQQKAKIGTEEAYRDMAREARGAIEDFAPEVAPINRRWGDIEQAEPVLERAAGRIGNRDMLGIGVPIKAGVGAAIGGAPGAMLGAVTGALDAPMIKARLARSLEKLRKYKGDKTLTGTRALAAQAGRTQDDPEEGIYPYGRY